MNPANSIILYYTEVADGIALIGTAGQCRHLTIPDTIEGKPVVELADYALVPCEDRPPEGIPQGETVRRLVLSQTAGHALLYITLPVHLLRIGRFAFSGCRSLRSIELPDKLRILSAHAFHGCTALEQVRLPSRLETIEEYAFYDCVALKALQLPDGLTTIRRYAFYNCRGMTEINIPKSAEWLETGLFLNCDSLYHLHFGQCRYIADLIAVLNHALLLTVEFPTATARLLLPDFQYEYVEDTPARQFHQVNYGTGHLFRQCIRNSDIDFRQYDELFYLTRREDAAVMVLVLAVSRLTYPYRLQAQRRQAYMDYIREHLLWAASYYIERDDLETLRHFVKWGLFTIEVLPAILTKAQQMKKTEILSFLMDYQHTLQLLPRKKNFDL